MKWEDHRKWARKLSIPDQISHYVDRTIDVPDKSNLPEEYREGVKASAEAIQAEKGAENCNTALSLVIANEILSHDSGRQKATRGDLVAESQLRFLRQKGEDYVMAWYLHHHLDYLSVQIESGENLVDLIKEYKNEYPETHSLEIEQFLIEEKNELSSDLEK
ncbi:MAG: hypothetical protein ABEI86_08360 [Halobacteriaceae archaeon]